MAIRSSADGTGLIAADIDGKERLTVTLEPDQITLRSHSGSPKSAPVPAV